MKATTAPKKTVDLVENQELPVHREELPFLGDEGLGKIVDAFNCLVTIQQDWSGDYLIIRADSRVGVVETSDLRLQVRPKVSVGEFCTLIRYALNGAVQSSGLRAHTELTWNTGFENVLCSVLCEEMESILSIGFSRRYEERREALEVLRGRVLWERNFPWRGARAKQIICRYHRLTYDNLDNRLVLVGLRCAFFLANHLEIKRRVGEFISIFRDVASETTATLNDFQRVERGYNRLNEHYRVGHGLSRMLLLGFRPDALYESGKEEVGGIVLDMSQLFERFVERLMNDLLVPKGFTVLPQAKDKGALLDGEGHKYSEIRPDIEVWMDRKAVGVIDAKYKSYWATGEDCSKPNKKIANEDLYQLFFYQQRLQRRHELRTLPAAVIAAPLPDDDERQGLACVPSRYRRIRWQAGVEREGDVHLLLVPITRFLRLINQRVKPQDAVCQLGLDDFPRVFDC